MDGLGDGEECGDGRRIGDALGGAREALEERLVHLRLRVAAEEVEERQKVALKDKYKHSESYSMTKNEGRQLNKKACLKKRRETEIRETRFAKDQLQIKGARRNKLAQKKKNGIKRLRRWEEGKVPWRRCP